MCKSKAYKHDHLSPFSLSLSSPVPAAFDAVCHWNGLEACHMLNPCISPIIFPLFCSRRALAVRDYFLIVRFYRHVTAWCDPSSPLSLFLLLSLFPSVFLPPVSVTFMLSLSFSFHETGFWYQHCDAVLTVLYPQDVWHSLTVSYSFSVTTLRVCCAKWCLLQQLAQDFTDALDSCLFSLAEVRVSSQSKKSKIRQESFKESFFFLASPEINVCPTDADETWQSEASPWAAAGD